MDEFAFSKVSQELRSGLVQEGLWLKALIVSGSDMDQVRKTYIKYRVSSIKRSLLRRYLKRINALISLFSLSFIIFGIVALVISAVVWYICGQLNEIMTVIACAIGIVIAFVVFAFRVGPVMRRESERPAEQDELIEMRNIC